MINKDRTENKDKLSIDQDLNVTADKDNVNKNTAIDVDKTSAKTCRAGLDG